jgi:hypothetical protein
MTELLKRLRKLEATAAARNADGPASWPAKAAAVKEYAVRRMSPADQAFLREVFAPENLLRQTELLARDPTVWVRFTEAFEWATRTVPAPYVMSVSDLLGQW